jgi:uncharacterized protein YndB with AHSA1/START domain
VNTPVADTIFVKHTFNAGADKIWQAWTHPSFIKQWFGSDLNGKVLKTEMDVQPGGNFKITFRDSDGTEHTCSGIYKDVQPYNKLSFTWNWKNEPGVISFVTILLVPNDNTTLMKFEHAHVGFASAHVYEKGWKDTFLKLEPCLSIW